MHFIHGASVTNNLIYNPEAAVTSDFSLHEYLSHELVCFCQTEAHRCPPQDVFGFKVTFFFFFSYSWWQIKPALRKNRQSVSLVWRFIHSSKFHSFRAFFPRQTACVWGVAVPTLGLRTTFSHIRVCKKLRTARSAFVEVVGRGFPVQLQVTTSQMHVHVFFFCNTPRAADQRCQSSQNRAPPC